MRFTGSSPALGKEQRDLSSLPLHQPKETPSTNYSSGLMLSLEKWAHLIEIEQGKVIWRRNMVFGIKKLLRKKKESSKYSESF